METRTELKNIATIKDEHNTTDKVTGKKIINFPILPGHKPRGINAATVVAVDIIIGNAISEIPFLVASILFIPSFSISLYTFSTTTIPLSTSIPSPRIRPNNIMVFKVLPMAPSIAMDINIDIGIAIPTNKAFLNPRKNKRTITTSTTPKIILLTKSIT